jgi:MFS family permease
MRSRPKVAPIAGLENVVQSMRLTPGSYGWLSALCMSRALSSTWFVAYSAVLPITQAAWGLSSREAGLIQSAFQLGFLISTFLVGFISDYYGAKRAYLGSSIALGASAFVFAVCAQGFWSAFCLHAITGLCAGGTYSPALAMVKDHVGAEQRGRAMGLMLASSNASYALCLAVAAVGLKFFDWRVALCVVAGMPIVACPAALAAMHGTPNMIHPRPPDERAFAAVGAVIRERRSMLSILGYAFHNWELLGMWTWLPAFIAAAMTLHDPSMSHAFSISLGLSALTYVTNIGGSIVGGIMADRWGRTETILIWSCTSIVLSTSIGWLIALPVPIVVALACLCNFGAIADSATHSTVLAEGVPSRMVGIAYSVRSVLGFGAGALSPLLFGTVLDLAGSSSGTTDAFAWGLAWTTLGVVGLAGPLATWRLHQMVKLGRTSPV